METTVPWKLDMVQLLSSAAFSIGSRTAQRQKARAPRKSAPKASTNPGSSSQLSPTQRPAAAVTGCSNVASSACTCSCARFVGDSGEGGRVRRRSCLTRWADTRWHCAVLGRRRCPPCCVQGTTGAPL